MEGKGREQVMFSPPILGQPLLRDGELPPIAAAEDFGEVHLVGSSFP